MTVEAARATMLGAVRPLPAEAAPLLAAMGRTLAEDVFASRDQPPFAASAMDGWAVRSVDGEGVRRIAGESAAGRGFDGVVAPGEAVRIFTGAPCPMERTPSSSRKTRAARAKTCGCPTPPPPLTCGRRDRTSGPATGC